MLGEWVGFKGGGGREIPRDESGQSGVACQPHYGDIETTLELYGR